MTGITLTIQIDDDESFVVSDPITLRYGMGDTIVGAVSEWFDDVVNYGKSLTAVGFPDAVETLLEHARGTREIVRAPTNGVIMALRAAIPILEDLISGVMPRIPSLDQSQRVTACIVVTRQYGTCMGLVDALKWLEINEDEVNDLSEKAQSLYHPFHVAITKP